jgi:predicted ATPase/class 3 adenylate cyclase/predicted negative regulator of RcsB-dependent stress response
MSTELLPPSASPHTAAPVRGVAQSGIELANRYVARILQQHLVANPESRCWTARGSAVLVDISGFTQLSERLARKGREGAEQISDAIGSSFESVLQVAYDNGGSLLKFGGDSLLLWYVGESHLERACRAMLQMRRVLRDVGRLEFPDAKVTLRMAQAVQSGEFHFFAVGTSHVELLPTGPAWSRLVALEKVAQAGEIVVSEDAAASLPSRCVGKQKGGGVLLQREPPGDATKIPLMPRPKMAYEEVARCLSVAIRAHVLSGGGMSEHRHVTIAFIRYEGIDPLIDTTGPQTAADALHRLVSIVEAASEEYDVTFLASDVDADGGKLILTAGAPKVTGDDEEHMLLALRQIIDSDIPVPIRIGVHRGSVFAGDIGPFYRRTYTVMGDAVNLAARLMAMAEPGQVYATADVLDRSNTLFETAELLPFAVKGKAQLVQAWAVGRAKGSRTREATLKQLPLIGRDAEIAVMRNALAAARAGSGRLIEIVGEGGIGKTRLLEALREDAKEMDKQHAVCEAYSATTPYAVWTELLRELMKFGRDASDAVVESRLREMVAARAPDLMPWLPLIAIAFGLDVAPTPEIELLADENRRPKLHEVVGRFLAIVMPDPALIEIENAQHMDAASADLLGFLCGQLSGRPWLFALARRETGSRFKAPELPTTVRLALEPLAADDVLQMAQRATEDDPLQRHVLEVVAKRSGGNPQFLRDLLHSAIVSGGIGGLPDSAEAAAMARIDALAPEDRTLVRRASVFGLTFHPRMLSWFGDAGDAAIPAQSWNRLRELFDEEPDGYLRFRRSLLRDAAYEGLPYKLRRQLHGSVAARMEEELDEPEEAADILSLHYLDAGEHGAAWRYANAAGKRAQAAFAYVEAAGLYSRAVEAGRRLDQLSERELGGTYEALGDSWQRAGEPQKAFDAFAAARRMLHDDTLRVAGVYLKCSKAEEKLGEYRKALRWAARAGKALQGNRDPEAARHVARSSAWYALVLQRQGRTNDAMRRAQQAIEEAEAADDAEALGAAALVMGWACSALGRQGAEAFLQRSLEAYRKSGNLSRQAIIQANLGVICQWEGRWDEALEHYERGRQGSLKVGNTVSATLARMNIGEILSDRNELIAAEEALLEALPVWRASKYRHFLGGCLLFLARVSLKAGRIEEALKRLDEARTQFVHVGASEELLEVDGRLAECRARMGEPSAALELATAALARARAAKGGVKVVPMLERARGDALLQQGDFAAARQAYEASLAAARARRDLLETSLALRARIELDRVQGVEPSADIVAESAGLLGKLRIAAIPATSKG